MSDHKSVMTFENLRRTLKHFLSRRLKYKSSNLGRFSSLVEVFHRRVHAGKFKAVGASRANGKGRKYISLAAHNVFSSKKTGQSDASHHT